MAAVIRQFPSDQLPDPATLHHYHHRHQHRPYNHNHDGDDQPPATTSTLIPQAGRLVTTSVLPATQQRSATVAEVESQARLPAGQTEGGYAQTRSRDVAASSSSSTSSSSAFAGDKTSRIPSPPSSSPAASVGPKSVTDDASTVHMASHVTSLANPSLSQPISSSVSSHATIQPSESSSQSQAHQASSPPPSSHQQSQQQQPSPPRDDLSIPNDASRLAPPAATDPAQTVIHIRDLAHIQSLAKADLMGGQNSNGGGGILNDPPLQQMKYEISGMPIGDVIEMVAALLTKITTTNDLQHDAMQRNAVHQQQAGQSSESSGNSQMSPLSHSVLAFHGKNVPGITILSYLSRIHKYCPTTYEVFLSLLVYFDRMTERVNDMVTRSEETRRRAASQSNNTSGSRPQSQQQNQDTTMADKDSSLADSDESDSDLADEDDDDDDDDEMADSSGAPSRAGSAKATAPPAETPSSSGPATYFVVDSFNIHRLIIAGVTCASKFFSDVFYTNSRYAKVGGLPLVELNHLELQFLLLNDFRLAVPVEDLEAYATMLVEFYAREVVASKAGARAA